MAVYSIRDLEKISGIKAHTIRMWERRYNIVEPMRTQTNIRLYSDGDLKRLLNISILSQNGFKISAIARLNDGQIKDRVIDFCMDTQKLNVQIEQLIISMLELDDTKFSEVLNSSISKQGFEKAVEDVVFPFLDRVGVLWQAGSIVPAQEHFISNLIRQKLIVAIDNQMGQGAVTGSRIVFFLPEGEYHELGLLFYSLIARKLNLDVLYLGASVPMADLKAIDKLCQAPYYFTFFVSAMDAEEFSKIENDIATSFNDKVVFISGLHIKNNHTGLIKPFKLISSVDEFTRAIADHQQKN